MLSKIQTIVSSRLLRRQRRLWCTEQLLGVSQCPPLCADPCLEQQAALMAGGSEDLLLGAVERDGLKSSTSLSVLGSQVLQDRSLPAGCSRSRSVMHIQMCLSCRRAASAFRGSRPPQVPRYAASPIYNCMRCRNNIRLTASHSRAKCYSIYVICSSSQAVVLPDAKTLCTA